MRRTAPAPGPAEPAPPAGRPERQRGKPVNAVLEAALADLAGHPDSSAKEIGTRIGADSRVVYRVLRSAAFQGLCQSRRRGSGGPWLWELPGCTACTGKQ